MKKILLILLLLISTIVISLGSDRNFVTSIKERAEQGDAIDQPTLGAMYYNGEGVEKDYAQAFKWFRHL